MLSFFTLCLYQCCSVLWGAEGWSPLSCSLHSLTSSSSIERRLVAGKPPRPSIPTIDLGLVGWIPLLSTATWLLELFSLSSTLPDRPLSLYSLISYPDPVCHWGPSSYPSHPHPQGCKTVLPSLLILSSTQPELHFRTRAGFNLSRWSSAL